MDYMRLGAAGVKVSRICLGCMTYGTPDWRPWVLGEAESRPFFKKALDVGINFFDTADMYSIGVSEEVTGRALLDYAPRDQVVIASKVWYPLSDDPNDRGLSRKHIMHAIDNSLKRLGTDYIDLYQIHRYDPETPPEETMEALHDLVKAGKVRHIGASTMRATQFARLQHIAEMNGWTKFVTMQNHYNLIYREEEREMNPFCVEEGVGLLPWSPLARGFFAGNKNRNTVRAQNDPVAEKWYFQGSDLAVAAQADAVAEKHGCKAVQVALAWLLSKPGVVAPIVGASKINYIDDAVRALELNLDADDIATLEDAYVTHPAHKD